MKRYLLTGVICSYYTPGKQNMESMAPNALSKASQNTWTVASLRDWDTTINLEMCREDYWWSFEVYDCHRSAISDVRNTSHCSSQHQGSWTVIFPIIGTGANRSSISENLAVVWRMRPFVPGSPSRFLVMSPGLLKRQCDSAFQSTPRTQFSDLMSKPSAV